MSGESGEWRSRLAAPLAASLALVLCVGCVSRAQYADTRAALLRERGTVAVTATELASAAAEIRKARDEIEVIGAALRAKRAELDELERSLSGAELTAEVAVRDRSDQGMLVGQLRAELARDRAHLEALGRERATLQTALVAVESRLERAEHGERVAARRVELVREITLAVHEALAKGELTLALSGGEIVLRATMKEVFREPSGAILPAAEGWFEAVGRVARARSVQVVVVSQSGVARDLRAEDAALRLERVAARLREIVGEPRVTVAVPPPEADADAIDVAPVAAGEAGSQRAAESLELTFRLSP